MKIGKKDTYTGLTNGNNDSNEKDINDRKFIFDQYGNKIYINNVNHKKDTNDRQVILNQFDNKAPSSTSSNQKLINAATLQELNKTTDNDSNAKKSQKSSTSSSTNESLSSAETSTQNDLTGPLHDELVKVNESLVAVNSIKTELCRLPLDFCQREYFNNQVNPLLTTLTNLAITSSSLASAVNTLTVSPIVPRKKGKLKDTINLIYNMNSKCKDVYKELEDRIDTMLNEDC